MPIESSNAAIFSLRHSADPAFLKLTNWTVLKPGRSAAFLIPTGWIDSEQKHAGGNQGFSMSMVG
jgi:hypothetical protein